MNILYSSISGLMKFSCSNFSYTFIRDDILLRLKVRDTNYGVLEYREPWLKGVHADVCYTLAVRG